ncbi:MAG: NAD(+)/NADH kinase [Candidatus Tectomicrobia bacterium]|nr:NAD(+)/NADH kinase [Candidatus Tectomicrobia bacterium]
MTTVGIIVNPSAGKDIRRLVAYGRVVSNDEKVNIVRRVLLGLDAAGVSDVVIMPDSSALGQRALDGINLSLKVDLLDMPVFGAEVDSARAAGLMAEMGVACLVTLGGDGTNRAVAKGCDQVPLIPISTGTNNVFPSMIEGTIAGLAAAIVARGLVDLDKVVLTSKRLEIYLDGQFQDVALVDVAVSKERFVAARAIWDVHTLHEVFLTRAEPTSIGLSSIGAQLHLISMTEGRGLYFQLGPGRSMVLATVAPGMVRPVAIEEWRLLPPGERVEVVHRPCTIALDGEREISILPHQRAEVMLSSHGPRVVEVAAALREAARQGVFVMK